MAYPAIVCSCHGLATTVARMAGLLEPLSLRIFCELIMLQSRASQVRYRAHLVDLHFAAHHQAYLHATSRSR
ncbi:uncharacterized protein CC84DRAFT_243251 [Paraphaeosphaeria sporulosa]|uniref:Uncharacterized protein n=1 Tax=Paraphaeosphaeria sporulosa TaxID=1460663 RepID=A0A177C295_9PLEO|nr:uncharacterized protein CC84DRAFT_243251 [Paraphaeosphaeria sporulosa]OAG00760.1 hypothetical protein CC84DRAFT_243251 [Paraphaeosphaeria sporulosa]